MRRKEVLDEATRIVCGAREQVYGTPEDTFRTIADLWTTYLETPISDKDVSVMMIMLKIARIKNGQYKADNWIDIAGYAACGSEIEGGIGCE